MYEYRNARLHAWNSQANTDVCTCCELAVHMNSTYGWMENEWVALLWACCPSERNIFSSVVPTSSDMFTQSWWQLDGDGDDQTTYGDRHLLGRPRERIGHASLGRTNNDQFIYMSIAIYCYLRYKYSLALDPIIVIYVGKEINIATLITNHFSHEFFIAGYPHIAWKTECSVTRSIKYFCPCYILQVVWHIGSRFFNKQWQMLRGADVSESTVTPVQRR